MASSEEKFKYLTIDGVPYLSKAIHESAMFAMMERAADAEACITDLIEHVKGKDFLASHGYDWEEATKAILGGVK